MIRFFTFAFALCAMAAYKQQAAPEKPVLAEYFSYSDSVELSDVKMIPIKTTAGNFKVWTKRFGSNPHIKILLLHGGPALTHEYMECFEKLFQREDGMMIYNLC